MKNGRKIIYESMDRTSQQIEDEREKAIRLWDTVRKVPKVVCDVVKTSKSNDILSGNNRKYIK